MTEGRIAQEDIENIYELTSIGFGPVPGGGWSMASRFFYRCPRVWVPDARWDAGWSCTCGNLYRESIGRFGANTGDGSIEVFEARNRRTGEYA